MSRLLHALCLACGLALAPQASAASVPLPAAVAEAAPGLAQRGAGTMRWLGVRVYDATLWTAQDQAAVPDYTLPFALGLRYARSLKGAAIAERSVEEIAKLGLGTPAQRAAWGESMKRIFPDVEEGTALTGVHLPGLGARFYRNGVAIGGIADPEFSRAFFSIWLDPRTSEPGLRRALLGGG